MHSQIKNWGIPAESSATCEDLPSNRQKQGIAWYSKQGAPAEKRFGSSVNCVISQLVASRHRWTLGPGRAQIR
jgi:hypothetical protein